jgi:PEGA domain
MLRLRLVAAATIVVSGIALAGCSSASSPSWVPSWLQTKPPPPPVQALQFVSDPPGADVHTIDGQTCRTPCTLALPLTAQTVSIAMNGYLPQSVPVGVQQTADTPNFLPNPVAVTLQSSAPPPVVKPKRRKVAKTAKNKPPASAPAASQDSVFPPPPPLTSSPPPSPQEPPQSSPFPPPPPTSPGQ